VKVSGAAVALFMAGVGTLAASSPAFWEMTSYQDFIKGKFDAISLSRDGRLSLAPKLDTVFASGQPVIWSIAQAADGTIYAGTGHRGRVYKITPAGQSSVLWTADQPEVFAVAVDAKGVVYAATSPAGKIYRIEGGKAELYYASGAKYVWSLVVGPDGALYAGTGDGGKVYRITAANQGEEYYSTGQTHVTGLSFDREGRLLAGTEPNGMLFRISAKDKAFVLYGASLPEIRAVSQAPDGSIYAVAMGGSVNRKLQQLTQGAMGLGGLGGTPTFSTSITVTADASAQNAEIKPPEQVKPQAATGTAAPAAVATATTATAATVDVSGIEKSAIYKIHTDNTVETLWSSKEENVYDLLPSGNQILFSTDANGRIYRLSPDRRLTLLLQTNEGQATRLLKSGTSVLAATGNLGRIYRMEAETAAAGAYESPVYDAGATARWGRLHWSGDATGGSIALRTRSGNSLRPDPTWSDWSAPVNTPDAQISSPNARFIQWRAEFTRTGAATPSIENVSVAYLPQNSPPLVKSITAVMQVSATPAKSTGTSSAGSTAAYSITVTDTGDAGPAASTGTPTQTLSRAASQQLVISWQAEDPDNDRLVYTLYYRGEGEREWKLLKGSIHETSYTLDGDTLADGRYFFRVVASDREVNPADSAREAELISSPVLIDNTPPVITVASQQLKGGTLDVVFSGADAASALRRCEYSLDAGTWLPLQSDDGVIDSPVERFHLHLENLPEGEHVIVLRVMDSGNNAGLKKLVLR
jgi:sugar lactone lactonase YvrE